MTDSSTNPYDAGDPPSESEVAARKRSHVGCLALGCLTICFLFCAGVLVYLEEPFKPRWTIEAVEPIVVLASDEELWCFVQVNTIRHEPGKLESDPFYRIGHRQVVAVVDSGGVKERIAVTKEDQPDFYPKISEVFHSDGGVFLYQGKALNKPASLHKWQKDHFEPLQTDCTVTRIREFGLEGMQPPLDDGQLPQADGWSRPLNIMGKGRGELYWNGYQELAWGDSALVLELVETEGAGHLRIHFKDNGHEWSESLVQFDPRKRVIH